MKNILMNIEMTKAILEDRKTQTRRAGITNHGRYVIDDNLLKSYKLSNQDILKCGKYQVGDIIGVRESVEITNFIDTEAYAELSFKYITDDALGSINSDNTEEYKLVDFFEEKLYGKSWVKVGTRVPNGCLKEMTRIFLKITDVKVERLQDISIDEIEKEGVSFDKGRLEKYCTSDDEFDSLVREEFLLRWIELWNKTAPKGHKWEDNPYVFVYEFKKVNKEESEL